MIKILKDYYLFLILFFLIILKNPIYRLIKIPNNIYMPINCQLIEKDYNKLLEFSEIDLIYESNYINTYVLYKDIYNYKNEITIRGGKEEGFNNNPVIYDNTLLGVISNVSDTTSIVKLLTNTSSKISVKINDNIGVLEYKNNNLIVSNISNYSNINIGDYILTSGLGNIKENIFIGYVENISLDSKNIEKLITVNYGLSVKDIDYVTVLKENK